MGTNTKRCNMKIYEGLSWGWLVVWLDDHGHVMTRKFEDKAQAQDFVDNRGVTK